MGAGRKTRPYAVGVAIQAIYAATIVISKASFDQGLSIFVYILYRQAAACLLLLPVAILLERCLHDFKLFDCHGCSCIKSSRSGSLLQAKRAADVFPAAAQDVLLLPGQVCMSRSSRYWMIKLLASSCQ